MTRGDRNPREQHNAGFHLALGPLEAVDISKEYGIVSEPAPESPLEGSSCG